MKKRKLSILIFIGFVGAIAISYKIGFNNGCRKVIGNWEDGGHMAMETKCYGPSDYYQEFIEKLNPERIQLPPPPGPPRKNQ